MTHYERMVDGILAVPNELFGGFDVHGILALDGTANAGLGQLQRLAVPSQGGHTMTLFRWIRKARRAAYIVRAEIKAFGKQ